jgi:hypothetical protein
VSHALKLISDCAIYFGMRVAMDIRPDRGISVKIAMPFAILKHRAVPTNKNKRGVIFRTPFAHWSEGMP